MGHVHTEITLKNAGDAANARKGYIREGEIHSLTVSALVDTGASMLFISEEMRQKLGLMVVGSTPIHIANGTCVVCPVTEPVDVEWKSRATTCRAAIIPGSYTALLGVIPLEALDLTVNPVTQEVVGAHGDEWSFIAMTA